MTDMSLLSSLPEPLAAHLLNGGYIVLTDGRLPKLKLHIICSDNTTYCGRGARGDEVDDLEGLDLEKACVLCVKSFRASHVTSDIYDTAGGPR